MNCFSGHHTVSCKNTNLICSESGKKPLLLQQHRSSYFNEQMQQKVLFDMLWIQRIKFLLVMLEFLNYGKYLIISLTIFFLCSFMQIFEYILTVGSRHKHQICITCKFCPVPTMNRYILKCIIYISLWNNFHYIVQLI